MSKPTIINLNEMLGLTDEDIVEKKQGTVEVKLFQLVPFLNHSLIRVLKKEWYRILTKTIRYFIIVNRTPKYPI